MNDLQKHLKALEMKAEFANKFAYPRNKKEYKLFRKIMKDIDEKAGLRNLIEN